MSDLPEGWTAATLGTILADIQPGFAAGRHSSNGVGLAHLRPMNVSREGRIDLSDLRSIDPSLAAKSTQRLRRGDVLFNNTNSLELVGKTALFDRDDEPAFSNHMTRLRVDPRHADPAFVAALLHERWRAGEFRQLANNHVSQASVGRAVLASLPIALPPIPAQHSIAELVAEINERRASIKDRTAAARAIVDRLRTAVLAAACSGRLTADWRDEHDDSTDSLLSSLRAATAVRRSAAAEADPVVVGELPETWHAVALDLLVKRIEAGKSVQAAGRPADADEWGVIKVSAMSWGSFLEAENKAIVDPALVDPRYEIHAGDLLISRANTVELVGATVHVGKTRPRLLLSDKSLRLVPHEGIDKAWLNLALSSPASRSQLAERATGTSESMRNLSQPKILGTQVALPPLAEQRQIVRRATTALETADRLRASISAAEMALGGAARSAGAKAFRGELVFADDRGA